MYWKKIYIFYLQFSSCVCVCVCFSGEWGERYLMITAASSMEYVNKHDKEDTINWYKFSSNKYKTCPMHSQNCKISYNIFTYWKAQ